MRAKIHHLALTAVLGAWLISACTSEVTVDGGCDENADCSGGQVCRAHLCVPDPTGPGGGPTTATSTATSTGTTITSTATTTVTTNTSTSVVTVSTTSTGVTTSTGGGTCDQGDCIGCFFSGCAAAACINEFQACINDPSCYQLYSCLDQCPANDESCYDQCLTNNPVSEAFFSLYNCVICNPSVCYNSCQGWEAC